MPNSKAFEMAVEFRNKAIAVLRLQKVNGLTQELQEATSNLKSSQSNLDEVNKKIADVNSGEYSPSYADVHTYGSADEAKAAVLKDLGASVERLTKSVSDQTAKVAEVEGKITAATKGEKPYKFSRDAITEMANSLIEQSGNSLDLALISAVDDTAADEEFEAKV